MRNAMIVQQVKETARNFPKAEVFEYAGTAALIVIYGVKGTVRIPAGAYRGGQRHLFSSPVLSE